MSAVNYPDPIIGWLAEHEGGFVDHPADPGGATMRGVTQAVYDAYRRARELPRRSVRHLTDDEHGEIYRRQYWDVVRGDEMPGGLDYSVFDAAVNSGPARGTKWLQRAVGAAADGVVGPMTLDRARIVDAVLAIKKMAGIRMGFLRSLRHWATFGRGWSRRVAEVEARSLSLAKPAVLPEAAQEARQTADRANKAAKAAASGTAATGGAGGAETAGADLAGIPPEIWFVLAAALLILAGVFLWQRHKHRIRAWALEKEID